MAVSLATENGLVYIPDAYASYRVATIPSGLAVSGVLVLVGEAAQGPDYASETVLANTFYGPDQAAEVLSKYGSGPLVDAFYVAASPSSDPEITGAPSGIYLIKTNTSAKASASLLRAGTTNYATIADKNYGEPGNGISFLVSENAAEVAPTSTFTYMPTPAAATLGLRVNGGSNAAVAVSSLTSPPSFVAQLNALASYPVEATGGSAKAVITAWADGATLAVAVSGLNVTITGSVAWDNTPAAGDVLLIPVLDGGGPLEWYETTQASVVKGAGGENCGLYLVTAATSTTISATKIHDLVSETPTSPVTVVATAISTVHDDIKVYKNVTVNNRTGTARSAIGTITGTVAGSASGTVLTLTRSVAWDVTPQVNDLVLLPSTAPAAWRGGSDVNVGWYRVTASSSTTATLQKLDTSVSPATFVATAQAATTDLVVRRPAIDGQGKTMELASATNGDAIVRSSANALLLPIFATSATEQQDKVVAQKLSANTTEELLAGGDVVFLVGYNGTTATMTVSNSTLTTTVTGGTGSNLSITLKNYKTVAELASFINSQTGYSASAGNNLLGQSLLFPDKDGVLALDKGTFGICSATTNKAGRIKRDARLFFTALRDGSVLLQEGSTPAAASAGLPEAQALTFLTGGTRGGTTDANFLAAFAACEKLRANFIIPLVSRDATDDIADLLTDSSSTYTIDAVHAQLKSHVIAMSTIKRSRNRQGFPSYQGTFADAKTKAATLASFRCTMAMEDFKSVSSDGSIVQQQPWATAVAAAAMQAAGFYRDITGKLINTSGILYNDSTFDADSDTDVEVALQSGILVARAPNDGTGGFEWVSDQTTYSTDGNFVFNSTQAVYAADQVTLTSKQGMSQAFKGASLADVSAASALSTFDRLMQNLKRVKLLASSDGAPSGYKNAVVRIVGNTMYVSADVFLAVGLKFISISFTVQEVQQSAAQ